MNRNPDRERTAQAFGCFALFCLLLKLLMKFEALVFFFFGPNQTFVAGHWSSKNKPTTTINILCD